MSDSLIDRYAPLPTQHQLQVVGAELGSSVSHSHRIEGGLGGTIDVLEVGDDTSTRVVLRRYWLPEPGEANPAEGEARALALAAYHGIPAPAPLWVDRIGLFPERAIVISFVEGEPLLDPSDPIDWATQLAVMLVNIHGIRPRPEDAGLFPVLERHDGHMSEAEMRKALDEHPLGALLWSRLASAGDRLKAEEPVYVHHDYWPGNTLWLDERLSAVIDWEGGSIADPSLDVAYCAFDMRVLGLERAAEAFITAYRDHSGRPLENLEYWSMLALCRPMPDIAVWAPAWDAAGVEITDEEARSRHYSLIEQVLGEAR